jgi:hypothetical protein
MMRATVILHERLGNWNRQLRPRLHQHPVRWFESRSPADLEGFLEGLAFPVILIDLGRQPVDGLTALGLVAARAPDALSIVLDPEARSELRGRARELGATYFGSGYVPPPFVAELLARWITIAQSRIESAGWSRTPLPDTATNPWSWLVEYLGEPADPTPTHPDPQRRVRPILDR